MKSFNNILYVVEDLTSEPVASLARAVSLAENNQARLTIMHVVEEPRLGPFSTSVSIKDVRSAIQQQSTRQLQSLLQGVEGSTDALLDIRFGTPFIKVIQAVQRNRHDLVIKTEGEGGAHNFLFGGTDQHLLRKCPCPVWILVGESSANYRQILAAVDFDPWAENEEENSIEEALNQEILNIAASLSISDFAQLHIVHSWQSITENIITVFSHDISEAERFANRDRERREHQSVLELLDSRIRGQFDINGSRYLMPQVHLREGNARDVIPAMAKELEVDLVVMGTVSRTGIPGLLIGSTAEVILNNLDCSVLAIKPPGFITPVTPD